MKSFIREELTAKLLNDNNMEVKLPLYGFMQNYLSSRYNFIPKVDLEKKIRSGKLYDIREFAIYMFQCNALLNVECIEFDHSCFIISKEHSFDTVEYTIPQPDGFDYAVRNNYIDFHFIKTPFFMLNNIVHPETYDTKTLYLYGLYETFRSPTFDKNLMPFGEGIIDFFKECDRIQLPFKDVASKLILSQLPSFNDYFDAVLPILLNNISIVDTYPSILKFPNDFSYPESKSSLLLSINNSSPGILSEYDEKLIKKYNVNLEKILPFETLVYSYPLYSPVTKSVIYNINSSLSYGVYIKLYNRVMKDGMPDKLERIYKLKKSVASYLKSYYFSYHMQHSVFKHLYPVSAFISHERPRVSQKIGDNVIDDYQPQGLDYFPTWTLGQIKSIKNKDDLFRLIIKTVWYNNKFMASKLEKDLKTLINDKNLNDLQAYNKINELYKKNKPKETGFDRGQFRYDELKKLGLFANLEINDYTKYLDFGGGIGDVSSSISKNLKLKKENSFVTDIQNWLGKEHTDEYIKYITYRYLKTNSLPFEDGTFNIITCLQVLHHIPDKKYTISQLRRVINSNGILIVREHDCRDVQDRTMIDIEHSLHAYAVDEQGIDYFQNYHDNYMSKDELSNLMKEGGFELVNTFPEKGLTRYYYSVWKPAVKSKVKLPSKSWADDISSDEEVDLNLDKNKQPNLTFKKLSEYDKDDVVDEMKSVGFPYHKYYMNTPDYYFNNLKNFKYTLNPEIVDRVQGIYFKSPITYIFKEPELFGIRGQRMTPTLLTMKEDYSTIDVITNLFTEEQRIKAKVYKGKSEAISPFEFWMTEKSKIIDRIYSEKQSLNSYTLRETIFELVPEATLFKTTVAKSIYDIFKPTHILDMSSGWGDRLIAAIAYCEASGVDVKYSGFDPNSSLKYKYMEIVNKLAPRNKQENFKVRTEPFESANLKDIKDVDLFFSSPPYFDFEVYTNEETQSINNYKTYSDWVVKFLFKSIKNAFSVIVKDGYFVIHITDTGNMRNVCELIKLYIEEYLDGSYIGCIFTQAPGKRRQPMWVFKNIQDILKKDQSLKNDKNMNKLYPEIYNLIIKVENEPSIIKNTKEDPATTRVKKEEPLPPGFFNF
jgi:ubiquinone/menaquinone biosynthesis C-methylase UbiE